MPGIIPSGIFDFLSSTSAAIDSVANTVSDNLQGDKELRYPSCWIKGEVPLWINFKNFAYTSEANARSNRIGLGSMIVGQDSIWLPLPHTLQTSNGANFESGESPESSYTLGTLKEMAMGWGESLIDSIPIVGAIKKAVETKIGRMDADLNEAIFQGMQLRTFNYRFEMVPKTPGEAANVGAICSKFQSTAYPRAGLRTSKQYHPPLWGIGVYKSGGGRVRQWDMSPQNCVMTSVNINTAAEGGGVSSIDGLPSVVTLDLSFMELEPNLRTTITGDLVSRSRMKAGHGQR